MDIQLNQRFSAALLPIAPAYPTLVDIAKGLSREEIYRVAYLPFVVAEVMWDYADTLCNIGAILRHEQSDKDCRSMKLLSRAVRTLRREYEQGRAAYIDAVQREVETTHMIEFQEGLRSYFTSLRASIENDIHRRYGEIRRSNLILLLAVYEAIVVYRALLKYADWADRLIEKKCGRARHSIIPDEITRLGSLLPQYAGDCVLPTNTPEMNLWRDTLCNKIHAIELEGLSDE